MERPELVDILRSLLPHLQHPSYLARQPLAALLVPGVPAPRGSRMRQVLLDLINELQPISTSIADAECRQHRHLLLRYVDGHTRDQIANTMGLSTRQASRDHEHAITALADLVWTRIEGEIPADRVGVSSSASRHSLTLAADLRAEAVSVAAQDQETTDLAETIDGIMATFAPLWAERGLLPRTLVPDTLPRVVVSRTLLRQAIVNALTHVMQFVHDGQVLISGTDTARGPTIRIAALGMAQPPLNRVDEESLDVCRRLLETQDGAVDVEIQPDSYCVTLTLPSVQLRKVLVVDDNPDVVMLFQRYLRGESYRVVQATNGRDALKISLEMRPDVITLDVMLPSQDGWDIMHQLRSHPETRDTPFIVCSVLPERAIAMSLGAADFLAKPISRSALLEALNRCLAGRATHQVPS